MTDRPAPIGPALDHDRRVLLEQWAGGSAGGPAATARGSHIPRRGSQGPAPMSFAQQRLWFLEQLQPGQSIYVIPVVLHLTVAVRVDALRRALDEIVRRHEVLRSVFVTADDEPRQITHDDACCPFHWHDLRGVADDTRAAVAREHMQREAEMPFDFAAPHRVRATLLTLADTDHVLVATFHHIAFDGWSTGPFLRELSALYSAFVQNAGSPLAPLPIQYADYAAWQRRQLADVSHRAPLLDYWTRRLAGLRVPEITPDFARPSRPTYRAGRQSLTLPRHVVGGMKLLGQREGVTPFMVLLAAVNVLVQRHSSRDDVCVGTSVAGRSHAELEPLIGCCLNTLVLRTDLSDDPRVSALLTRVRETALGAFAHQSLPFELLLQQLQPARDLAPTPLFQVYVNYLNVGEYDPAGPRLEVASWASQSPEHAGTTVAGDDTHGPFDLALYARPVGDQLALSLVYARDLFAQATADLFLRDLRTVLAEMVEHPDARISTLALSTHPNMQGAVNAHAVPAPSGWSAIPADVCEQSIGSRFEDIAARHAARVAVCRAPTTITFGDLADTSRRIAAAIGVHAGPGDRVGVLLGHDAAMPAGLLGVLQSGAAYVPLDPAHPLERLAAIVESARPTVLLVANEFHALAEALETRAPGRMHLLRYDAAAAHAPLDMAAAPPRDPDATAYILYTSGSTGVPKGVEQSHRNVLRHLRAYVNSLRIVPDDSLSLLSTYGFDAAVMDIFGALFTGATLMPIALRVDEDEAIARALSRVTVLHATPTVFRHLMTSPLVQQTVQRTRVVVLGGEPALRSDVELYREHFAATGRLVNGLGPTESTLALQYVLTPDTVVNSPVVPIGFPVADTTVRLLNADGAEVGPLAVGEIAIASEQVALGYWNDPELTARAFRRPADGTRVRTYMSGDLAWRDRAGCLHFAGRRDGQVKVRGVRIEIDEVERRLLEQPDIAAAAVALDSPSAHDALVAYVVVSGDAAPDAATLRRHLLAQLPDAMVPTRFARLGRLPMTVSGKIDRAALPPLEACQLLPHGSEPTDAAPASRMEQQLASLWCEVLGLPSVNRTDNFFELGGHSLLATQVISRVRTALGRAAPLRVCFEAPTLEALARAIEQAPSVTDTHASAADASGTRAARERHKLRLS